MKKSYPLAELAQYIDAELVGDPNHHVSAFASLQSAQAHDISFIASPAYARYLATSDAGAVILSHEQAALFAGNKLVVANPYVGYARLTRLFDHSRTEVAGVHPSAVIGEGVMLGENVSIAPHAVVGKGASLGDGVVVGPGTVIGEDTIIGNNTRLMANVTIYHGISIGSDCIIHSGSVIGADGFGFAPNGKEWVKIHQLGSVIIGNRVEIGACSTVDRGALGNTVLDDGVIIDNLVHIAHNVRLGKNCAMAATSAIAGSTTVGENCTFAGGVGVVGHIDIGDNIHFTGMTMVSSSLSEPGSYSSGTPISTTKEWRKNAVRFRQLDAIATRLSRLEKDVKKD
ncbi:UDP-3-O-(3-hydroxymyristoyl)glucosamine N-acyltransferase [Cellvibrio sp. ARAG 10.3]|uniref:UDP-3-O-(3-hydroxymyristoyl)glucosamine N-acyltransferase n=1 Tax=Cellvibrio sp. ARAG 10.3 TaxID=3451358 RepID=UPI003F47A0C1